MNKKHLSLLAVCLLAVFSITSCKKDSPAKTITVTDTVTIHTVDTVKICAASNSVLSLFTHKQWIPDTIYINYTGPGTGSIVYIRGSNSNAQDHDGDRGIFWANGYEDAFDPTGYNQWTWSFNGTDSTSFTGNNGAVTNHVKILELDATHLTVQDSTFQTYSADVAQP